MNGLRCIDCNFSFLTNLTSQEIWLLVREWPSFNFVSCVCISGLFYYPTEDYRSVFVNKIWPFFQILKRHNAYRPKDLHSLTWSIIWSNKLEQKYGIGNINPRNYAVCFFFILRLAINRGNYACEKLETTTGLLFCFLML